jgi:hypothetical protein
MSKADKSVISTPEPTIKPMIADATAGPPTAREVP